MSRTVDVVVAITQWANNRKLNVATTFNHRRGNKYTSISICNDEDSKNILCLDVYDDIIASDFEIDGVVYIPNNHEYTGFNGDLCRRINSLIDVFLLTVEESGRQRE